MLTINQVNNCVRKGVCVRILKRANHDGLKGYYDPSILEVRVYAPNAESKEDLELTILHEMIHARDDVGSTRHQSTEEEDIEKEAVVTYKKNPKIIDYINHLYKLKY